MTVNAHAFARSPGNAGRMQIIGPRFAVDVLSTPGVNSVWGNYASIIAAVAGNWWVLGAYVRTMGFASAGMTAHSQVQLATGAAGFEVPFATIGEAFSFLAPAATGSNVFFSRTFLFPPQYIPNATVVRFRSTVDQAGTVVRTWVSLFGIPVPFYDRPNTLHRPEGFRRGRTGLGASQAMADMMLVPDPLTYTTVTLGGAAFGNWVTALTAAAQTQPLLVTGVKLCGPDATLLGHPALLEIGIGEAAAAVGIEEVKFCNSANMGMPVGLLELWRPIYIPPGSGLSLRGGTTGAAGHTVTVQILTQPLK